jgi:dTDP-4-dehydrorhamnose 3,5-epimerase
LNVTVQRADIADVLILQHETFEDDRGFFMEVYKKPQFAKLGLPDEFVQLNHSRSAKGVVRGLHFQWDPPMGKLIRVTVGEAFFVSVDIRHGSTTLGKWTGIRLSANDKRQVWAPAGFARGFCILSDFAEIEYLCTSVYNAAGESGIRWDDPEIGIEWPVKRPTLSDRDRDAQSLSAWLARQESRRFSCL